MAYAGCLLGALALIACLADGIEARDRRGEFDFAVLGDNRSTAPVIQPLPFKWAIEEINLFDPDFVVVAGDMIRGYTPDIDLVYEEWDEFDRVMAALRMPFHLVVGNHDVWDKESEQVFESRYGRLYYSFDHHTSHFIVLDSDLMSSFEKIDGVQLDWLKGDLEAHKHAEHVFVIIHKPLWLSGDDEDGGFPREVIHKWDQVVHPLLVRYGVEAVIGGHKHFFLNQGVRDGIRYLITGGAGAPLRGERARGGYYHWIRVEVRAEQVLFTVMPTGSVVPEDEMTLEAVGRGHFLPKERSAVVEFLRPPTHLKLVPKHTCRFVRGLKMDGDLKDWDGVESLSLEQKSQVFFYGKGVRWNGPEDLSARVLTAWDKHGFYLAAVVKDDTAGPEYESELMFLGDCIQVAFDPLDSNDQMLTNSDSDVSEFGFAVADGGAAVFCYRSPVLENGIVEEATASIRFDEEERSWRYEVALPWEVIASVNPEDLSHSGFNIIVNDNDGHGRRGWIQWTPGLGESKDASWFGDLVFEQ